MSAVFRKEVTTYFNTMIGYVYMGVFLFFSGLLFNMKNINEGSASISELFGSLFFVLILLTPFLTMRLMAEEKKTKTDQMLLTSPVPVRSIVLGKYFAAVFVLAMSMAATLLYVLIIAIFSSPYFGEILLGYVGYLLLGGVCISIGLFISSIMENQLSAVLITFVVLLLLWMPSLISVNDSVISSVLGVLSIFSNYAPFARGILSISSVLYMLSFSFVFLMLTVVMTERRRWGKG
jgi:ABC-2 type transport system permease protein